MTDKELRRLSRAELLEMLLAQMEENETLRGELEEARAALADRRLKEEKSGTMAEAALRLNGIFEAADRAARQYLENIRLRTDEAQAKEGTQRLSPLGEAVSAQSALTAEGPGAAPPKYTQPTRGSQSLPPTGERGTRSVTDEGASSRQPKPQNDRQPLPPLTFANRRSLRRAGAAAPAPAPKEGETQ